VQLPEGELPHYQRPGVALLLLLLAVVRAVARQSACCMRDGGGTHAMRKAQRQTGGI
jgi:hypothetical protein